MPYKGSAQSVGFKTRVVPNDYSRMRDRANKLDQRRKEEVLSLEQQARGQEEEMRRIDTISTKKEEYELGQLRQFSATLNEFLDTAATEVGKPYIDKKRQEGMDIAANPQRLALTKKQNDDIDRRIREQRIKSEKLGQSWDKKKEQGFRVSLEEQERALSIRKLGSNVRWGYIRGTLLESAEGYPVWRDNQLIESEDVTDSGLTVKDYHRYEVGSPERKEIIRHLQNKYVEERGDIGSAAVQSQYLIQPLQASDKKLREQELSKGRKDLGFKAQQNYQKDSEILSKELITDLGDDNKLSPGNQSKLTDLIQEGLLSGPGWETMKGGTGSARERNKVFLKDTLGKMLSTIPGDDRMVILESLENQKFVIPGLTGKDGQTLTQIFGDDFSTQELEAKALAVESNKMSQNQQHGLNKLKVTVGDLSAQRVDGKIDEATFQAELTDLYIENSHIVGFNTVIKNARSVEFQAVSVATAEDEAIDYLEEKGEILRSDTLRWPKEVRDKYEKAGKIVDNYFAMDTTTGQKARLKSANTIKNKLNAVRKELTKDSVDKNDLIRANKIANAQVVDLAKKLLKNRDPELERLFGIEATTPTEAVRLATQVILNDIEQGKDQKGSLWAVGVDGKGFLHERMRDPDIPGVASGDYEVNLKNRSTKLVEAREKSESTGLDVITNDVIIENTKSLEVSPTGQLSNEVINLTRDRANSEGYTLYEVLNKQRALHGLPPEDDPGTKVDESLQKLPPNDKAELKDAIVNGDDQSAALLIDKHGGVDIRKTHETFLSTTISSPIFATANLPGLIKASGLNVTVEELANNPVAQEKLQRYVINDLLGKAAAKTNNQSTLLRMVAAGLKGGEAEMDNYLSDDNREYTLKFLRAYQSGNFDLLKTPEADYQGGTVPVLEPGKDFVTRTELGVEIRDEVPLDVRAALDKPISTNLKDLQSQLRELNTIETKWRKRDKNFEWSKTSIKPHQSRPFTYGTIDVKSGAHQLFLERKRQVQSRIRILEGKFSERNRLELYQAIATVVGEDKLAEYRAKGVALGYAPIGPKMNKFLIEMAKKEAEFLGTEFHDPRFTPEWEDVGGTE